MQKSGLLLLLCLITIPALGQSYEDYVDEWSGEDRARFATYRFDRPDLDMKNAGYVSDRPLEWSQSLGIEGVNELVDPFQDRAKHVLFMVHGYGPGPLTGGGYIDRNDEFSTQNVAHDTGVWAWYGDPTGPSLYSYLRELPPTYLPGLPADGFDPNDWVILGVTLKIDQGFGRSILENQVRLRALVDLLWYHYEPYIKTISFVSHSTGGPIVKGLLGATDPDEYPWLNYVDDHLSLAGAFGGTPFVILDVPAGLGAPALRHQLMYGVQHPQDYTDDYFYSAGLTAEDGTFKRTYRWPEHINVLSIAGVWEDDPFDGNPWSGSSVGLIPYNISNPADLRVVRIYESKSDAAVPSTSTLEQVQYQMPFPGAEWRHQIEEEFRYGADYSSSWTLPNLGSPHSLLTTGGAGYLPDGSVSNADNVPTADRFRGEYITYVEVNAQHNGMLHNEHVLRTLRRRLGTRTVKPNVARPVVTSVSPAAGPPEGGNTVDIYGSGFTHLTQIYFGEVAILGPFDVNNPPPLPWTIISENHIQVAVPEAIPRLQGDPSRYFVNVQVVNTAGASLDNGVLDDYEYVYPAAAPTITPNGGQFDAPPEVTLETTTAGATILYTLNGSEPRTGNPTTHVYSGQILIPVPLEAAPITLRARATKVGFTDSDVAEATFEVDAALPSPSIFPDGGDFTSFVNVSLGSAEPGATIFYTLNGTDPTYNSTSYTGQFQLGVGDHTVKARSYKIGYNASAISEANFRVYDASTVRVADPILYPLGSGQFTDSVVVRMLDYTEGASIHYTIGQNEAPANPTESDPVYTEPFVLTYDQADVDLNGSTNWFIRAKAFKDGTPPSNIVQRSYDVSPAVAATLAPTFTPAPDTFHNAIDITVASATQFARLYITTDGTEAFYDPDNDSESTPHDVSITKTTTLRALAKRPFFSASAEVTGEFVLKGASPVASVEPTTGTRDADGVTVYVDSATVSLTTDTENATMRYTLDGSEPTSESAEYTGPFYVTTSSTVTARAFKTGYVHSDLATRTLVIQQGEAPVILQQPHDQLVDVGGSATFRVIASGVPEPAYQWQFEEADIEGATADTLHIASAELEDAGAYRVVVTNAGGSATSADAVLTVDPTIVAPSVITHPSGRSVVLGSVATLSVAATGKPAPTFQWLKEGAALDGATGAELTLRGIDDDDAGEYRAVATNSAGSDTSDVALLEVYAGTPPVVVEQPLSLTLAVGDTARFWVNATGDPAPSVQWMRDGVLLLSVSQDTLVIAGVTEEDAGSYAALIMNAAGIDTSEVAILNVSATAVEDIGGVPRTFALHVNYPNPFNPATTISFDLARAGNVRLTVYDVLGRRITVLRDSEMAAGRFRERFDFSHLASGLYFYEIHVDGPGGTLFRDVRQFILMK